MSSDQNPDDVELLPEAPLSVFEVEQVVMILTDGIEVSKVFPNARLARYRIRQNTTTNGAGTVTRRFTEHEIFWTEERE